MKFSMILQQHPVDHQVDLLNLITFFVAVMIIIRCSSFYFFHIICSLYFCIFFFFFSFRTSCTLLNERKQKLMAYWWPDTSEHSLLQQYFSIFINYRWNYWYTFSIVENFRHSWCTQKPQIFNWVKNFSD